MAPREPDPQSGYAELDQRIEQVNTAIKRYTIAIVILGILGLVFVAFGIWFFDNDSGGLTDIADFLTGTTGITWSLAGLLLIYVAFLGSRQQLLNQEKEIRQNFEELGLTRNEVAGQKEALLAQNTALREQQIETTFFQLLNLLDTVVASLHADNTGRQIGSYALSGVGQGKRTFRLLYEEFGAHLRHNRDRRRAEEPDVWWVHAAEEAYRAVFERHEEMLGPYFRTLYHLVRFVDRSELSYLQKKQLVDVVRAQLTSYELVMLYYNCLVGYGFERFRPRAARYGLLKHLRAHPDFGEEQIQVFGKSAFEDHKTPPPPLAEDPNALPEPVSTARN